MDTFSYIEAGEEQTLSYELRAIIAEGKQKEQEELNATASEEAKLKNNVKKWKGKEQALAKQFLEAFYAKRRQKIQGIRRLYMEKMAAQRQKEGQYAPGHGKILRTKQGPVRITTRMLWSY